MHSTTRTFAICILLDNYINEGESTCSQRCIKIFQINVKGHMHKNEQKNNFFIDHPASKVTSSEHLQDYRSVLHSALNVFCCYMHSSL